MNTFVIRNQRKILYCGGYCSQVASKFNKYSTTHYRTTHLTSKTHLNSCTCSYGLGRTLNSYSSQVLSKHTAVLSTVVDNERTRQYTLPLYNGARGFHINQRLYENPSSKVEATVQTMKNKQKEKVEEILKEAASSNVESSAVIPVKPQEVAKQPPVKKPLKTRIWEEIVHYYHGFRLLFVDINICRKLLWRVLNGNTLTRRENKLLVRTTSDLFRLIPFAVFIIVPFMELLLPFFIKFFPGMLPSTFQTSKDREDKLRQSLQVRLEMAKFLQKTLDEMPVQHKEHKSEEAKQFSEFFQKIKDPNEYVASDEIIKFAKRFEDEITLDSLSREQLAALCRVLELNTMGTTNFLRFHLRVKLRSLAADDRVIAREGVSALDLYELQQACKSRGMRAYGLTAERLRSQLQEWIDLSLNEKVPPTLLLLSRAMLISDDTTTTDKLKETMRVLSDSVAAQTKAAIGEREGKIDNKTKIEIMKEEERKIKEEREEEREEQAAKSADELLDKAPVIEAGPSKTRIADVRETLAAEIKTKEEELCTAIEKEKEKSISSKDVELLSDALKTLSSEQKMMVERETIKDLKEELADYKEDLQELDEVRNVVKEPVRESRAAKMLFKKVNNMIGQLDKVLEDLEKKHQKLQSKYELIGEQTEAEKSEKAEIKRKGDELVHIDELVNIIKKLKQTSDESRLEKIESILSKLDTDKDGVITVDEVLKVIEAIGRDNVKLDEKQLEDLITLLDKEELIEAEIKIEKALAKESKFRETKEMEEMQKKIDEAEVLKDKAAEMKDSAPELKDKAADMNVADKKNNLITETSILEASSPADKQKDTILPKPDIPSSSATIPPTIPPPPTTNVKVNPKDKML